MTQIDETARLRTQLREVNIEYSALVRSPTHEDAAVRLDQLKLRRNALMSLIAQASRPAQGRPSLNSAAA